MPKIKRIKSILFVASLLTASGLFAQVTGFGATASNVSDPGVTQSTLSGNITTDTTLYKALSPYNVTGDVTILDTKTLTIEPGVELNFQGHYAINVQGRLMAVGTIDDSIRFKAVNPSAGWRGIRFSNTPATNDSSIIKYSSIRHGKANVTGSTSGGAIYFTGTSKVNISYNLLENNYASIIGGAISCENNSNPLILRNAIRSCEAVSQGGAIYLDSSSPGIVYNKIENNTVQGANYIYGGGIYIKNNSNPLIINNLISGNRVVGGLYTGAGAGIYMIASNPVVFGNVIANNSVTQFADDHAGGGLCIHSSNPVISNNTIVNNSAYKGGAVFTQYSSSPSFSNNIIRSNIATSLQGNQLLLEYGSPVFKNNNIQNLQGCGSGNGNIDLDPLFVGSKAHIYDLQPTSPCRDSGLNPTAAVWLPFTDLSGDERITNGIIDIGAYEYSSAPSDIGSNTLPSSANILTNYPNPFNPSTTISFELQIASLANLTVYNAKGELVKNLVNGVQTAGKHNVNFDGSGLNSGVYFYKLDADGKCQIGKMLMVK